MLRRIVKKFQRALSKTDANQIVRPPQYGSQLESSAAPMRLSDWQPVDVVLYQSWLGIIEPHLREQLRMGKPLEPRVIGNDVYQHSLLSKEGTHRLLAEMDAFDAWASRYQVDVAPPNSMHRYGVILSELGFGPAITELFELLKPTLSPLYPEVGSDTLDSEHAFVVAYSEQSGDRDLGFHVDNSEVTLNITLEAKGNGGALYFQGRRCEGHRQHPHRLEEELVVRHTTGALLIHSGAHRHGVYPINGASRRGIIVWLSSSKYRQESTGGCEVWCGDHSSHVQL